MAEKKKLRIRCRFEVKRQDCWIGFYWHTDETVKAFGGRCGDLWICLLPMLPLHVWWSERKG